MPDREQWWRWGPDVAAALVVLLVGLWQVNGDTSPTSPSGSVVIVFGLALAVGLTRVAPGAALATAWCVGGVHVVTEAGPLVVEVLLAVRGLRLRPLG